MVSQELIKMNPLAFFKVSWGIFMEVQGPPL